MPLIHWPHLLPYTIVASSEKECPLLNPISPTPRICCYAKPEWITSQRLAIHRVAALFSIEYSKKLESNHFLYTLQNKSTNKSDR